jgi:hypothetical protein
MVRHREIEDDNDTERKEETDTFLDNATGRKNMREKENQGEKEGNREIDSVILTEKMTH